MPKYYQHTINGKPAEFDGEQIVFSSKRNNAKYSICKSLKEIRKQQKLTKHFRAIMFREEWEDISKSYDYVIIYVPESD